MPSDPHGQRAVHCYSKWRGSDYVQLIATVDNIERHNILMRSALLDPLATHDETRASLPYRLPVGTQG